MSPKRPILLIIQPQGPQNTLEHRHFWATLPHFLPVLLTGISYKVWIQTQDMNTTLYEHGNWQTLKKGDMGAWRHKYARIYASDAYNMHHKCYTCFF